MEKTAQEKILLFNVNWLGDVLFSTAAISALRKNFPGAHIACALRPSCKQVLENNPNLDELIIYDEEGVHKSPLGKLRFIRGLAGKKFTCAYLLHRSLTRALLCFLAGIPKRVGYDTSKRGFLLTHRVTPLEIDKVHRIEYYLGVLEGDGIKIADKHTQFFPAKEEIEAARAFIKENFPGDKGPLVAINPGGNWMPKRWPPANFAKVADGLCSEFGARLIITGSKADRELAAAIAGQMQNKAAISADKLTLRQFAGLCTLLDLFISADTGPLHIAHAARAKNIIGIFGPTSVRITGPYPQEQAVIISKDVGCSIPCYQQECPDNRCMKAITPQDVLSQARRLLGKR